MWLPSTKGFWGAGISQVCSWLCFQSLGKLSTSVPPHSGWWVFVVFFPPCGNMYAFYSSVIWKTSFKSSERKNVFACQTFCQFLKLEIMQSLSLFLFLINLFFLFLINLADWGISEVSSLYSRLFFSSHVSTCCPLLCLPLVHTCIIQSSQIIFDSTRIDTGEWSSSHWDQYKSLI